MIWQDVVILVGQAILGLSLIPTIWSRVRVPLTTSLPATITLAMFAGTFLSLDLYGAAITSALNAATWGFIAMNGRPER
jgi:hypothetical protein